MSTRFADATDLRFDLDGESVVLECSSDGRICGHLAIPTVPTGRTKPLFIGEAGIWGGPRGALDTGIAMVGFDLHTCHGAYQWGLESSLLCLDPAQLAMPKSGKDTVSDLLFNLAAEVVARHASAPMLLIGKSPHTPVSAGFIRALIGNMRMGDFDGLIVEWPQVTPHELYVRAMSRADRARKLVTTVASSNPRIHVDADWLTRVCLGKVA